MIEVPGCDPGPGFRVCSEPCKSYSFTYSYSLDLTALYTVNASKTFNFNNDAQPAIDSNGSDVLVAWFNGSQVGGGDVVALRLRLSDLARFADANFLTVLGPFPPDAGLTRPAIANDGLRYVVVWRVQTAPANHDIVGVAIDNDGRVTPFSIATSSADERDPAILALGDGAFLVAYEKMIGFDRRIAGRFVTFGRHRAVR